MRRVAAALLLLAAVAGGWHGLRWIASFAPQGSALDRDELPFYSHADLLPRWDGWSRGRSVGGVELIDADGAHLDEAHFAHGPTVVTFFWSGCVSVCPLSIDLLRALPAAPPVLMISDQPLLDRPAQLRDYRRRLALPANWRLATGAPDTVYRFARHGLFTDVETRAPDGSPRHAEIAYLLDRAGRLRGLYDANSAADVQRLGIDLARLTAEATLQATRPI